jgi:hypothetical protein
MSIGQYGRARDLLLDSLANRERHEDNQGQAVCLGRLSEVAMLEGDYGSAYEYNEKSREAYETAADPSGAITCHTNGASIALELDDIESAVNHACDGITLAARLGDIARVVQSFRQLMIFVVPRLSDLPQILYPVEHLSFAQHMELVARVAEQRDLGRLAGAVSKLMENYGPGGIPAQGSN